MKRLKTHYYLIAFAIFYLSLVGVMSFYFHQVIKLEQRAIATTANEKMDEIFEESFFVKAQLSKEDLLYKAFIKLTQGRTTLEQIQKTFKTQFNENNEFYTKKIDSTFQPLGYGVASKVIVTAIILHSTQQNLIESPFVMLETSTKVVTPHQIQTSEWEINERSENKGIENCTDCPEDYNLHITIKQEKQLEVTNYLSLAILKLMPLLVGSIFICLLILVLFTITYQTIRKKENEIESLHNIVDNVSHEFKLPIATLKFGLKNLSKDYTSSTLSLLQRQVDRLEKLQNQLSPNQTDTTGVLTQEFVYTIVQDFKVVNPSIVFTFNWNITKEITTNLASIETIINNLVENSIKYGSTIIHCTLLQYKKQLVLEIKDNGIGIDQNEISLIFRKFYRVIQNNVHNTKGLGIGLYQIKNIIDQQNGSINVKSKINHGTTFTIKLPYE